MSHSHRARDSSVAEEQWLRNADEIEVDPNLLSCQERCGSHERNHWTLR
jgi:hypothetical protein